jgi:hypothetical protein
MSRFQTCYQLILISACFLFSSLSTHANLYFWTDGAPGNHNFTDPLNWDLGAFLGTPPQATDLAVHNQSSLPAMEITSNVEVDTMRLSTGGSAVQSAGTLIIGTQGPDKGFFVGEHGDSGVSTPSVYDFTGGVIQIDDDNLDGELAFMVGKNLLADGVFNMSGGATVNAQEKVVHFGLDANATVNQTGGTINAGHIQVGRFQSPTATWNLSGSAQAVITGNLLLSDGSTPFVNAIRSDLNITGSNVGLSAGGIYLRDKSHLNYVADAGGVSPIVHTGGGGYELKDQGGGLGLPDLTVNLTPPTGFVDSGQDVTLIQGFSFSDGSFNGLPEGGVVPNSGGRFISYRGGPDGFDVELQVTHNPYVDPTPVDGVVTRWSMGASAPDPFFGANVKTKDSRLSAGQGIYRPTLAVTRPQEDLWVNSDTGSYVTSSDVPPSAMFANGNIGGSVSYDAGATVPAGYATGALYMPTNEYGTELSFDSSFSVELFFKTGSSSIQQLLLQGENYARYGMTVNEDAGGVRFFVNDGSTVETIDIGGSTGEGNSNYSDGLWHYALATFEAGTGTNGTGLLTLAIANENGDTNQVTRDLPISFLGLSSNPDDGNLFIGVEDFELATDLDPRRFEGLIDEVQLTRGIVGASDRLGVLNLSSPGDFDQDGDVDGADFLFWQRTPGIGNLSDWLTHYGTTSLTATVVAVPEPTAICLAMGLVVFGFSRKHR